MSPDPSHPATDERFFAPCPRGLEQVLRSELDTLGARSLHVTEGGVAFRGPLDLCYRINLGSRIASRVLWQVGHAAYRTEEDLYREALALPWPTWFASRRTIKVKVSARHCPLNSLDFATLRIKDAVCDRFRADTNRRPSVDTRKPDVRIDAFLDPATVTYYLDTTGEALFKRGFRRTGGAAPLRENLAAGILHLADWTPEAVLLDPMCGGGTFLIEAALMACGIPPGWGRSFAFEKLKPFDPAAWARAREASQNRRQDLPPATIYGCDRSPVALETARRNLQAAGIGQGVELQQADVLTLEPPAERGLLVTNPPYGVRQSSEAELLEFYPRLGDALKQRFPGWRACLFTADLRLPKLIGLATSRRTPLFNGSLECRLYEFRLVRGPMRAATVHEGTPCAPS